MMTLQALLNEPFVGDRNGQWLLELEIAQVYAVARTRWYVSGRDQWSRMSAELHNNPEQVLVDEYRRALPKIFGIEKLQLAETDLDHIIRYAIKEAQQLTLYEKRQQERDARDWREQQERRRAELERYHLEAAHALRTAVDPR